MRPQNNKTSVRQRELDSNLSVNPFEDGNTPVEHLNQGVIYTSELDEGYSNAYEGHVTGIISEKRKTGTENFFLIDVEYTIDTELPNGWFGNNLISKGEPFIIVNGSSSIDFNYVKGYVVNIDKIEVTSVGPTDVYSYRLLCSITEGDVSQLLPSGDQVFKTNRRLFSKETKYVAPIELYSTTEETTNQTLFFWEDPTNLAVSYRLNVRLASDPLNGGTFIVNGNHSNFYGSIETQLSSGSATDWKITDASYGCSFDVIPVNFVASGNLPSVNLHTDSCGSIEITDWEVLHISSWNLNPNYMVLTIQPVGKKSWANLDSLIFPQALWFEFESLNIKGYVRAATSLARQDTYSVTIYPDRLISEWNSLTGEERLNIIMHQKLKIHTGIEVLSTGSNMTKPPKISYDKYSTNTKFVQPISSDTWYWSVASVFDCEQKTYSEWSPEELLIVR